LESASRITTLAICRMQDYFVALEFHVSRFTLV
jgi:hypothetical protein